MVGELMSISILDCVKSVLSGLEKQIDQDGLECSINGHQTYFETYVDLADNVIADHEADWIKPDITNQDIVISFV